MRLFCVGRVLFVVLTLALVGCHGDAALMDSGAGKVPIQGTIATREPGRAGPSGGGGGQGQNASASGWYPSSTATNTVVQGTGEFLGQSDVYSTAKTAGGQDGITLNLVNAPLPQAAKTVLGDILGLNYTVADKATANITLQTTSPIPRAALIDAFEVALKASGYSISNTNGFYRIVPTNTLVQYGAPVSRKRQIDGPGIQFQIIPIQHVAAAEMKRVIEPIAAVGAVARVDESRNLIVVSGTASELATINNLVQIFDVDYMQGMSFALLPVKSSDPEAIVTQLDAVFGLDKDGPLKGVIRFIPNRRLGAVLVISSKSDQMSRAKAWVEKIDHAAEQVERQVFIYKIQNRQAGELATLLQRVLTTGDKRAGEDVPNPVAPRFEAANVASPAAAGGLGQVQVDDSRPLTPQNAVPSTANAANSSLGTSPQGSNGNSVAFEANGTKVVADEQDNSLVIQTVPKEYQRILVILQRLDRQPTQVMLEAVIAEITLNDELKFGIKWFFQNRSNQYTFSDAASGAVGSSFPGFSYFFSATNVKAVLDAMSSVTKVNVVSAPSLMVMANKKAMLQIGDQVPIVTQTAQGVAVTGAPVVNSIALKDTGVILSVTPRVNDNGRVVLDVEQEVSSVKKTTSSGIDSPTIQQRKIRTTITVRDSEVLALGGLIQQSDSTTKTQVPLLGNLPLVGAAFRSKDDTIDRTELVIFIRPQVVRNDGEAADVTEEFRSRIALDPLKPTRGDRQYRRDIDRIAR